LRATGSWHALRFDAHKMMSYFRIVGRVRF
jgi:hypothetical protein